jgi:hypothetical protein
MASIMTRDRFSVITITLVLGDFSKSGVTLTGQRYRLRAADGKYFISESYLTGKEQEHRVEFTLGSRRIQHYLTTIENGQMIVLPPSWDVQRQQWFVDRARIVVAIVARRRGLRRARQES